MTEQHISPQVTLSTLNELDVLRIQNRSASATIALQGAHLFEYTPVDSTNLLFVSDAETFVEGQPIRGGIPVCWPWFGAHSHNASAPAHGFVRDKVWAYDIVADTDDRTEIKFWLETDGSDPDFPRVARVELLASIGETLLVSLTTANLGETPFLISQALHTYFRCQNINDVRLHGIAGACYLDKLTNSNHYVPSDFRFDRETDWVVAEAGGPLGLSGLGEDNIKLSRLGSRSLVIWNPWVEKAKTLSHFHADEYKKMFCVETANVSEDSRLIKAKQSHVMVMELARV
ncbi:D-hexose-6-phosphate mutarotase [Reinekea sp. G2M2-21]|uniref:D-hexose-6-phosphate mutarotase n=1 Tax=Reinekea sp. G2M2-21 TaxID=2788942 RepID=UPI0018A975D0|nr:D-hexose-6-phosphate mutarotase [Reinekea sp. G2M2-21]